MSAAPVTASPTAKPSTSRPTAPPSYPSYGPVCNPDIASLPPPPSQPSCLDENGNPVDWWVALKAPNGPNYFMYDASSASFKLSKYNLTQFLEGAIMRTVLQIYSFNNNTHPVDYAAYNDAPPEPISAASSSYAHSKGVLMTNQTSGFWLIHSVPEWPQTKCQGPSGLPDFTYGQSFMCTTVSMETTDIIAKQLMINRPKIYDRTNSPSLYKSLPNFKAFLAGAYTKDPNNSTTVWQSLNGKSFTQFAKSGPYCKRDLWDDFVAPHFHNAINVETWRNGAGGRIGSICGPNGMKQNELYDVMEVKSVSIGTWPYWNGTQDHSKWAAANPSFPNGYQAVTTTTAEQDVMAAKQTIPILSSSYSNFSCVGDVNRMCSQEVRGGGALCLIDDDLWHAFNSSIKALEACYAYNPCTVTAYPTPAPSPSLAPSSQCYWCSFQPTTYYPSEIPTISPSAPVLPSTPTMTPSLAPTSPTTLLNFSELFNASSTNSAQNGSSTSYSSVFYLCSDLVVSNCPSDGGWYTGQTYFRLYSAASNSQLTTANASACGGGGSKISLYSPPACDDVYVGMGCLGATSCSGLVQFSFISGDRSPTKAPSSSSTAAATFLGSTAGIFAYIVAPLLGLLLLVALLYTYRKFLRGLCSGSDDPEGEEKRHLKDRNPSTASGASFVEDNNPNLVNGSGKQQPAIPMRIPKSHSNPLLKGLIEESAFVRSEREESTFSRHSVKSLDYTSSSPGML